MNKLKITILTNGYAIFEHDGETYFFDNISIVDNSKKHMVGDSQMINMGFVHTLEMANEYRNEMFLHCYKDENEE